MRSLVLSTAVRWDECDLVQTLEGDMPGWGALEQEDRGVLAPALQQTPLACGSVAHCCSHPCCLKVPMSSFCGAPGNPAFGLRPGVVGVCTWEWRTHDYCLMQYLMPDTCV